MPGEGTEVGRSQLRVILGAELHDIPQGLVHAGISLHARKGTHGGRWPKKGKFYTSCGSSIGVPCEPCMETHGLLNGCPTCYQKEGG